LNPEALPCRFFLVINLQGECRTADQWLVEDEKGLALFRRKG
jgi:hypothetical protein